MAGRKVNVAGLYLDNARAGGPPIEFGISHLPSAISDPPRHLRRASRRHDDGHRRLDGLGQVYAPQSDPRLHNPPPGTVFVDGIDVREIPLDVLRGAIGFVPQEPFLFSATLAQNIAFGARGEQDATDRVEQAAATARLDKDMADFRTATTRDRRTRDHALRRPEAADGDRPGVDRRPKILILDDALSAVDTYTEEEILARLRGVMRERTSIIVSHRVSTVRGADQILVMDQGGIAERGTHDQLVAQGGLYAELYRKQLLEEELAAS
jgi:ATP-binding cassette subfamily B protein